MFYGFVITEAGNSLLASIVAGNKFTITKVVMDKGTAESAEAARTLTAPIDPGPNGTSTVPTVEGNAVNMMVEYRSDLNGGLKEGFWIGGFAIFGKVENGAETMIYYGSLGEQKQYVSAYVEGTAPDVRRYPVSITVTDGVEVEVLYPAEAWMTAEDVADYFNGTIGPEMEESLGGLIRQHNNDEKAHPKKADLGEDGKIVSEQLPEMDYIPASEKGAARGVARLDSSGKLERSEIPDIDCGEWDTEPVAEHDSTPTAHQNLMVDGNNTAAADHSETLEEHMENPTAHQNLMIDGNAGQ